MTLRRNSKGRWVIRLYAAGTKSGPREQETLPEGTTHAEASRIHKDRVARASRRQGGSAGRLTLSELSADYLELHAIPTHSEGWLRSERLLLAKHILPALGWKKLDDIGPRDWERYQGQRLAEGAANGSINRERAVLRSMLTKALAWGYTERNPLPPGSAQSLPEPSGRPFFFEEEEWGRFFSIFEDAEAWEGHRRKVRKIGAGRADFETSAAYIAGLRSTRDVFEGLLLTGSRLGEILSLTWDAVNFERGTVEAYQTKSRKPKTVQLHPALRALLESLPRGIGKAFVFQKPAGGRWDTAKVQHAFRLARSLAGVRPELTIHTLRHTFASWLAMKAVPIRTISELLGHGNIATTMRYAHLSPGHLQGAAEIVGTISRDAVEKARIKAGRHFGATSGSGLPAQATDASPLFSGGISGAPKRNRTPNLLIRSPNGPDPTKTNTEED